jgi:adenylate cyclase
VDEIGQLATSFNRMSEGLAERDRVRDLLDKNVSPEVAAPLMRDGGALGGAD